MSDELNEKKDELNPETSKVSVDAVKVAETIAEKIAESIVKAQGYTSEKEKADLREHIFSKPSLANSSTSYDLKHMKLADFTLENVKGLSEQSGDEKVIINPYAPKRKQRLMRVADAAKILGFYRALLEKDGVAVKALSEGTDSEGGYLVPEEFRAEVVMELMEYSVMRNLARVFPMGTDTLDIPTLSARPAAYWTSENASISTTSAEFGQVTLSPNTLIVRLPISRQLMSDSAINLVPFLTQLFSEEIARTEDRAFFTGSGSGQPRGISQESLKSVNALGTGDFDDVITCYYKLAPRHRSVAAWVANRHGIEILRKVKDSQNRYIWEPSVKEGEQDTVLGRPIYEQPDINEHTVYFGDWKYYFIGDRESLAVEVTTEGGTAWERHRTEMKAVTRVDGKAAITAPFASITNL